MIVSIGGFSTNRSRIACRLGDAPDQLGRRDDLRDRTPGTRASPSRRITVGVGVGDRAAVVGEIDRQPALAGDARAQLGERAVGQDLAVADHDHARAQRLDVVHVVRREDHRHAALAVEPLDEVADRELRDGVEADRRLVEEQDRRRVEQRRREIAAHALAEGELAHRHVEQRREVEQRDQLVARARGIAPRHAVDVAQQSNDSMTGRSHHSCVRWPNTTPIRATCAIRSLPRHAAVDLDAAAVGHEDAGERS